MRAAEALKGVQRYVLVSVASEVAAAKGWLPGYFEFYFKGKAMAEAAATEAAGEGNAYVVKPSFIYGGDSFELFPPRVASGYGAAIEEILSNAIITKIADVLPGLLKVALRPPSSVDAVAGRGVPQRRQTEAADEPVARRRRVAGEEREERRGDSRLQRRRRRRRRRRRGAPHAAGRLRVAVPQRRESVERSARVPGDARGASRGQQR